LPPHEKTSLRAQPAPPLPDELASGRDRDQVGEALERDGVAVVDQLGGGVGQGSERGRAHRNKYVLDAHTTRLLARSITVAFRTRDGWEG
jgi:hypothetical protein